ncbi:MAG: BCD family MFS transporter [Anaerolineae bacterium]|nr:BCD family MFS transporter [Anaerolineae bacterium]MDW8173968.1 BCD family MFS transporter [Anaerolineae bacterium]
MDGQNLSVGRNLKIATFHLGSGMSDVLTTGVWNRIMISDLGFAATPISLLLALRYFLAPVGVWAGRMSDERTYFGFRRLFWVWLGRLMMVITIFSLGLATAQLARLGGTGHESAAFLWIVIALSMLLFSVGGAISGTNFLALIYDRAPEHQRGRAVGIVWTFLLLGFTVGGITFGILLPSKPLEQQAITGLSFAPDALQTMFIVVGLLFATLWLFSVLGEERRLTPAEAAQNQRQAEEGPRRTIAQELSLVWTSRPMRYFFFFLVISMFFAFSQDSVLEPFAGDVFGVSAQETNRFSAYWGLTAIVSTLVFIFWSRKNPRLSNTFMSQAGVAALIAAFAMFGAAAFLDARALLKPGLLVLGIGLGIWNVGALGLMMVMSPLGRAGTFLGFWTMAVTFARGGGVAVGGMVRDLWLNITGDMATAYGMVFVAGAIGLAISAYCLAQVNIKQFKAEMQGSTASIFAAAMD